MTADNYNWCCLTNVDGPVADRATLKLLDLKQLKKHGLLVFTHHCQIVLCVADTLHLSTS